MPKRTDVAKMPKDEWAVRTRTEVVLRGLSQQRARSVVTEFGKDYAAFRVRDNAIHEAGHAVAAVALGWTVPLVTLLRCLTSVECGSALQTAIIHAAGPVALKISRPSYSYFRAWCEGGWSLGVREPSGDKSDWDQLQEACSEFGHDPDHVIRLTAKLLRKYWSTVEQVAAMLVKEGEVGPVLWWQLAWDHPLPGGRDYWQ